MLISIQPAPVDANMFQRCEADSHYPTLSVKPSVHHVGDVLHLCAAGLLQRHVCGSVSPWNWPPPDGSKCCRPTRRRCLEVRPCDTTTDGKTLTARGFRSSWLSSCSRSSTTWDLTTNGSTRNQSLRYHQGRFNCDLLTIVSCWSSERSAILMSPWLVLGVRTSSSPYIQETSQTLPASPHIHV